MTLGSEDAEAWKIPGPIERLQIDWRIYYGRFEPEEVSSRSRRAQRAYREAHRLEPEGLEDAAARRGHHETARRKLRAALRANRHLQQSYARELERVTSSLAAPDGKR